jgi:hypothetical protein
MCRLSRLFPPVFGDLSRLFPPSSVSRKNLSRLFPLALKPKNDIHRDFRAYFPRPTKPFALISPAYCAVPRAFRVYSPRPLGLEIPLKGDFRAYFPRVLLNGFPTFRAYSPCPVVLKIPLKGDFRAYFPPSSRPSNPGKGRLSRLFPPILLRA